MTRTQWILATISMFSLVACSSKEDDASAPLRIPTYHEDVAPILAEHCLSCHDEGGIAPFSLVDYEDARRTAEAIRISTTSRSMPPFVLDNSGECNTYVEGRWLTDAQIRTIEAWARAGAPEGEPPKGTAPAPRALAELDRVDMTIDMKDTYTPDAAKFDDYRCFVLDPGLAEDVFITGFHVRPGAASMLHHLTLFSIDTKESEATAEALDAAEPGFGYSCIDDIHVPDARWLVGAGPGSGALRFPEGTGLRMRAGRKTILQIHYNQENGRHADRTRIDLMLARNVPKEATVQRIAATNLLLPPKQASVDQSAVEPVSIDLTLWGLWPHMHKLGTGMHVAATHDGEEKCLARVNNWDFHWQGFAHYTKPIDLSSGGSMRITCTYDTRGRDTTTTWGQGTNDEMCIAFFYLTAN
ncbi:hypothetical protein [Polyangium fumosum]|uniref:Copper type II ascorbate-dependent monooxygenase C-terminal domain-containing protein n=1 Tax=Polyangium fumosum TaxID=889272 RepID=A0A4U1JGL6_9BACT|nr:hypothetical protein [Polyangium fumosum]TKD10268.1 hypothetical protein E8A74_09700 [Polyangium fumosum]